MGRIFWCATLRALQRDYLSHYGGPLPFGETQPDRISIFVKPCGLNEGTVALTFNAAFSITLPDSHHGIEPFFLCFLTQVCVRTSIRRILFSLHLLLLTTP